MPEATMYENQFAAHGENKIGFAGKAYSMKPITVSERMHETPYE